MEAPGGRMAVVVHGGAFSIPDEDAAASVEGCVHAAKEAFEVLRSGKSAIDAVEAAVRCLEDNPTFDAGHGSVLNVDKEVEMDAIIVDGKMLAFGAVASVKNIANPVSLARAVMEKTEHVMLVGEGANRFAREIGVPELDPEELVSEDALKAWEDSSRYGVVVDSVFNHTDKAEMTRTCSDPPRATTSTLDNGGPVCNEQKAAIGRPEGGTAGHDTVGAVAIDKDGNIAAATSTGGISMKRAGRVGDSPLIGCGACCDNNVGGVSCTGHGEGIARMLLAQRALDLLESGKAASSQSAVEQALDYMWRRVRSRGGLIMIGRDGTVAKSFTTQRMAWASFDSGGRAESGLDGPRLTVKS